MSKEVKTNIMDKQKVLKPIHPGDILKTEFLETKNLTVEQLAQEIELDKKTLGKLIKEEIVINFKIASELGSYFKMSADFWLNLQKIYEEQMNNYYEKKFFNEIKNAAFNKEKAEKELKRSFIKSIEEKNKFQKEWIKFN